MSEPYEIAGHIRRACRGILEHYDEAADPNHPRRQLRGLADRADEELP